MLSINESEVLKNGDELVHFREWIPPILLLYVSIDERNAFLKKEGLYNSINNKNLEYRIKVKECDDAYKFELQTLKEWIKEHPQFEDFIKEISVNFHAYDD